MMCEFIVKLISKYMPLGWIEFKERKGEMDEGRIIHPKIYPIAVMDRCDLRLRFVDLELDMISSSRAEEALKTNKPYRFNSKGSPAVAASTRIK
jgi:hypothetical protein